MNRILSCVVALATLAVLSSCVTNQKPASAPKPAAAPIAQIKTTSASACVLPYFRLYMGVGYGPLAPDDYPPIPPAKMWVDVANWQNFLNKHTPYHCTNPPSDDFENVEMYATWQFQTSNIGGQPVPAVDQTGEVNPATLTKAENTGFLPKYCTIDTSVMEAKHRRHGHVKHRAKPPSN